VQLRSAVANGTHAPDPHDPRKCTIFHTTCPICRRPRLPQQAQCGIVNMRESQRGSLHMCMRPIVIVGAGGRLRCATKRDKSRKFDSGPLESLRLHQKTPIIFAVRMAWSNRQKSDLLAISSATHSNPHVSARAEVALMHRRGGGMAGSHSPRPRHHIMFLIFLACMAFAAAPNPTAGELVPRAMACRWPLTVYLPTPCRGRFSGRVAVFDQDGRSSAGHR